MTRLRHPRRHGCDLPESPTHPRAGSVAGDVAAFFGRGVLPAPGLTARCVAREVRSHVSAALRDLGRAAPAEWHHNALRLLELLAQVLGEIEEPNVIARAGLERIVASGWRRFLPVTESAFATAQQPIEPGTPALRRGAITRHEEPMTTDTTSKTERRVRHEEAQSALREALAQLDLAAAAQREVDVREDQAITASQQRKIEAAAARGRAQGRVEKARKAAVAAAQGEVQ
jgi:hypothetical protein